MALKYTVVDAFTPRAFAGNPACVIILEAPLSTTQMQTIALEYNLSETAFLEEKGTQETGVGRYGLRWFTPTVEIPLCGHATLASAHTIFSDVLPDISTLKFDTMSGELIARRLQGGRVELEFPAGILEPASPDVVEKTKWAVSRITDKPLEVLYVGVGSGVSFKAFVLVEVANNIDLKGLDLNASPLLALVPRTIVILTSAGTDGADFQSRVFAPGAGIAEDPVTGAAHCVLGPYWKGKLAKAIGEAMKAKQVSPRGGELTVIWDEAAGTCKLQGESVTVLKGELLNLP